MGTPDLTTVIVIGAFVGLFFVALGHAQMVWLARQNRARELNPAQPSSPLRTMLFWTAALLAAICLLRAAVTRSLPDRRGFLAGEDLFSVRPRPGLVARHETLGLRVQQGEVLLRFSGQDGEEAQSAIRNHRQLLDGQLEGERMRPLDFDPEIVRQIEVARSTLLEHEQRVKQLVSERDAIMREVTQQRLTIDNRQFRAEQDDLAAERELEPLLASLATERGALRSQEELLAQGLVSQVETARGRDAVSKLEGRVGQLQDQRAIFGRERRKIADLRALAERTLQRQLDERTAEIASETSQVETTRRTLERATAVLERDRPRAEAQRQKRLRQLEDQIEEYDSLLAGRGRQSTVEAPWDGLIGFREPSPASAPADNGPLLVLYRPGRIGASVRLEPGEPRATDEGLRAEIQVASTVPAAYPGLGSAETPLPGTIVQRALRPDGSGELRVACDPPDRVVRQLAMGGGVPVVVRLSRAVTATPSFRIGLGFAAVALGLGLYQALRRRAAPARLSEPPGPGPLAYRYGVPGPETTRWPFPSRPMEEPAWPPPPARLPGGARSPGADTGPALPARAEVPGIEPQDTEPAQLRQLGVELRSQTEEGALSPDLVCRLSDALAERGHRAAFLLGAGLGPLVDPRSIERAAFGLLAAAPAGALPDAIRDCAEFLQIARAVGGDHLGGALERLRLELIVAALDAAGREGSSSERAAAVVKPLVEA